MVRVTHNLAKRKTKLIQEPSLSIAGPLVFQMLFAKDEPELKEMYASLLSSAMDTNDTSAHPSFVSIIQQLTSDEAKILRYLANIHEQWPTISGGDISLKFQNWCEDAYVTNIERSDAYLDNFVRLRILNYVIGTEAKYVPEHGDDHGVYSAKVENTEYSFVELTHFGRQFLTACIENVESNK